MTDPAAVPPRPAPPLPSYPAFTAPYAVPATTGWQPPVARPTALLGIVALVLALVAAVGATAVGGTAAWLVGQGIGAQLVPTALTSSTFADLSFLTPVRGMVLVGEIAFWAGTVLGVWAIVQGIVAIVKRRGRGPGIAAVVIAPLGAVAYVTVVWILLFVGMGSTAASIVGS